MLPSPRLLRSSILAVVAAGCNCNSEYDVSEAQVVSFDAPMDLGSWLSMDIAPGGDRLAVAYYDRDFGAVAFAVGTPTGQTAVSWEHERIDGYTGDDGIDRGDRGYYNSMKVATDGTVWVAYRDAGGGLYAAQRTGPHAWTAEQVDPGATPYNLGGAWASLDLTSANEPVIAHHEEGKGTLRVTRREGGTWSSVDAFTGDDFTEEDTDGTTFRAASVGKYARLLIGTDDKEYIAFYDEAQQTLNLLEGFGGSYTHRVVDDSGNVGAWPSMRLDGSTLVIAYHDVGEQDLKFARRDGDDGVFEIHTVDEGEFRGADTEIFLNAEGMYSVVYFDGKDNDMMLASQVGTESWDIEKIGEDGSAIGFHNEAVTMNGKVWLASYNYTARSLFLHSVEGPEE